ncbi:putative alpha/Beta hydrolase [Helianthus annuus]|uniref:Alpha/Beta hydrolase n=1 Tax=Helianthus annuus TaxID=4232 RepID=A0A9K3H7T6_HELAN|nr:putative alpha/Beta hydrolase [Helianthus annuus]KAJ0839685.1 putative alpha/Beta hydrolase [Helianthus annuus]
MCLERVYIRLLMLQICNMGHRHCWYEHLNSVSKIVFTNGSQDPWRHASKQVSSPSLPSYLISCDNCGHGTDRKGCPLSPLVPEGPYFFGHKQYSLHQSNLFLNKL